MELRNVRAFLAIADQRHFGHAAASLNLTQPAISLRIQVLERELGIQLLQRNSREVHLTTAGDSFLLHARTLVHEEDRTLLEMKDHAAGFAGRLRISHLTLWNDRLPASIMAEFRGRYPAVKVEVTTGYSQLNMERLLARELELAFIGVAIGEHDGIAVRPLDRHEIVLVMTPTHHLARMSFVPVGCLRGEPMITVSAGVNAPLASAILKWLTDHTGEPPNVIREETPDQMAAGLAQSRDAVVLMTEHRALLARTDGLVYRRLSPAPVIECGVAYARNSLLPSLVNLLKTVDDVTPALPADLPPGELKTQEAGWKGSSAVEAR
jgi:DNA-binding transcriptional LysR family regulator